MNDGMEINLQEKALIVPASIGMRWLQALIVTVLPIACFALVRFAGPEWQDGKFSSYILILLRPQPSLLFLPLIAYSSVSFLLLLISPERFSSSFAVRLGIYTGALLAFQYSFLLLITGEYTVMMLVIGVFILLFMGIDKLKIPMSDNEMATLPDQALEKPMMRLLGRQTKPGIRKGLVVIGLAIYLVVVWKTGFSGFDVQQILSLSFILILAGILLTAPALCCWVIASTAAKLFKRYERPYLILNVWRGTGLAAWLLGFAGAWAFSIQEMFKLYASLPPRPPDCYIATAAARGHRQIVRARPVQVGSSVLWVNPQLQYLKCAELALMALAPGLHRPLRAFYDVAGAALARHMSHPLLADVAYLLLKPCEWLARRLMSWLIPELDEYAGKVYNYDLHDCMMDYD
jgi:hypothetical protein